MYRQNKNNNIPTTKYIQQPPHNHHQYQQSHSLPSLIHPIKKQKLLTDIQDVIFTGTQYCNVDDIDDQQQLVQKLDNIGLESFDEEINQNQEEFREGMFQRENYGFSPIIGTGGDGYIKDRYNQQGRIKIINKTKSWKQFINPEIDRYYQQLTSQNTKNPQKQPKHKQQYITPKIRQNNQYSYETQNNHQYQHSQSYINSRPSHATQQSQSRYSQKSHKTQKSQKSQNIQTAQDTNPSQRKINKNINIIQNQEDQQRMQNEKQRQAGQIKRKYEDKINILEHQNLNLKDQLFYLRAAILAQYQAKQSKNTTNVNIKGNSEIVNEKKNKKKNIQKIQIL